MTKILLKITMMRVKNKIRPEITKERFGFVKEKGTTNVIYILRTIIQCTMEKNEVYMCFVNDIKAFGRVRHDMIITKLKVEDRWKRSRCDRNLYEWWQTRM